MDAAATLSHRRSATARRRPATVALLFAAVLLVGAIAPAPAAATPALSTRGWVWPVEPFVLVRAYEAPAHAYGPGHRGVDLRPAQGDVVRAPASGTIAFAGAVAGRLVLTIDHGDGLVTTLEPVASDLTEGEGVARGDVVGRIDVGPNAEPGAVHFGVRLDGEYINPLLLLGGVPRAVLLPCC